MTMLASVAQSVRGVVAAVEDKLDAMTVAAEGGGAHHALSSKASTAHWPKVHDHAILGTGERLAPHTPLRWQNVSHLLVLAVEV